MAEIKTVNIISGFSQMPTCKNRVGLSIHGFAQNQNRQAKTPTVIISIAFLYIYAIFYQEKVRL